MAPAAPTVFREIVEADYDDVADVLIEMQLIIAPAALQETRSLTG
jgi:hypothetical protein